MKHLARLFASLVLVGLVASPAAAQRKDDWSFQWYWGAQAGGVRYKTATQPYYYDPLLGGHWFITANRTALYVGFDQGWFITDAVTVIEDPASSGSSVGPGFRDVSFGSIRRIMVGIVAMPMRQALEPYFGGGFALTQVLDPVVDCSTCVTPAEAFEAQNRAEDASSKAFGWAMLGGQMNRGKLSIFGHYIVTSSAQGFLIEGTTHTLQGGIRYSFGTAKEGVTERN
jgi:hypothetical protein